jgi:Tfp pilus assembly protein PilO
MLKGSRGPLIVGVASIAVILLVVFLLVLPKMNQVSEANEQLTAAQAEQGTLESQLAALEQAQAEAPEARAAIQEVERQIPPTADEAGLLLLIKNAAARSGVTLATLTPGSPTLDATSGLSAIPLAISASGTYFQLTEFLYSIETLPRAAKVLTASLAPGGGDTEETSTISNLLTLEASVVLYTSDQSAGPGSEPGPTEGGTAGATGATGSTAPPEGG